MKNQPELSPWKILMVDDDEDDFILAREMLGGARHRKYDMVWANTYEHARSALLSEQFDAVLMDYDLGVHTGLELIREMTVCEYPGAFVLYTGRGSHEVDLEAMQAGASMYLTKGETSALMLERGIRYAVERKQSEQALAAHQAQLEAIFEAQQDVVLLYDPERKVLRANRAFEEAFGFDPVGKNLNQIVAGVNCRNLDGQPIDWSLQPTPQALSGKKVVGARFRVTKADGSEYVVETSSSPLKKGDKIIGSVTVWHDITESQQRRQELQEANEILQEQAIELEAQRENLSEANEKLLTSEERFRTALKDMPIVVANLDCDLRYTWIYNPQGGFKPEDVLGQRIGILTDPESTGRLVKALQDMLKSGVPVRMELRTVLPAGEQFFLTYAEPLQNLNGEITGVTLISLDVTNRKRAEEELQVSEAKFATIFEKSAFAAAISTLPDGVLVNVNEAWEKIFGYSRQEALGKTTLELNINLDREIRERALTQIREKGFVREQETVLFTKSGEKRVLSVNIDIIEINGETYLLNTSTDITARRQAEEALRESERRLAAQAGNI